MNNRFNVEIEKKLPMIIDKVIKHRRTIHQNPELSCQEHKTTEYIKQVLESLSIKTIQPTKTGIIGIIGQGEPCIALRADIDALPIQEETGLEFKSKNEGIMHACGHDLHTAMLLGAAELLKDYEPELRGTIKLIFQHSEEMLPGGAIEMIAAGVLDNPKPKYVFAQHIDPDALSGTIAMAAGPVMASTDELYWNLTGKGSHAAQPQMGNDPIIAATQLVSHFQTMLNKSKNPLVPAVISITSIIGGRATNIFPDFVTMKGTLRTFDEKLRIELRERIKFASDTICSLFNVECQLDIKSGFPSLINDANACKIVRDEAQNYFSAKNVFDFEPKMWAEDFAYFAKAVPSVFWFLGTKESANQLTIPLHNPKLNPSEDALGGGTGFLAYLALKTIEQLSSK